MVYSFVDILHCIFLLICFLRWCRSFFYFLLYAHKQVTASSECSIHSDKIITREDSKEKSSVDIEY